MSDHDHDHDHGHDEGGGHEIDKMPSSKLFNLLFGLSALTLIACIGVVQLFNSQVSTMRGVRDAKVPFQLAEYRQSMGELENRWGMVLLPDDDGVPVKEGGQSVHESQRYFMPVAEARKRVLESPGQYFKATRPYPRWPNPDPNAPAAIRPGARGPSVRPAPPTGGRPMRVPGQPGAQPGQPGAQPGQPGAQPGAQ
ncbi:MAG: hypothetical protein KDK70_05125, partial [Myxococcales bacterium]|nr:hypothetical protein [Myxococcales bacterium]